MYPSFALDSNLRRYIMVTGANDVIAPPRRAVAVATELRRCMLKLLPRCGHLPHEAGPGGH